MAGEGEEDELPCVDQVPRNEGAVGKTLSANFGYEVVGLNIIKMALNCTCSCFLCMSKDIDVRQIFLEILGTKMGTST